MSSCVSAARPTAGMSFAYGRYGRRAAATFHSLGPVDGLGENF